MKLSLSLRGLVVLSQANLSMVAAAALSGCTGTAPIQPPTPQPGAPAGAAFFACPTVPAASIPAPGVCNTVRIADATLTCGGNGQLAVATSPVGTGGTRFEAQIANFSVYSATVFPINHTCFEGIGVPIRVTFGVTYTGDQGTELTAAGATRPCIVQSSANFSQFSTPDPIISIGESIVKDQIHATLDNAVINMVFLPAGSSAVPGRCARWRVL
jgi:hypothetical protein